MTPILAEEDQGKAVTLAAEVDLLQRPSTSSRSLGKLPKGTIVTLTGDRRGDYVEIDVELEDGEASGWIVQTAVKEEEEESVPVVPPTAKKKPEPPKKRGVVPKDESALLRRDPSFVYGASLGMGYHLIQSQFDQNTYAGFGPNGSGYIGYFLESDAVLKVQIGFNAPSGSAEDGSVVQFTMLDITALGELSFAKKFRVFGGLQYSMGIGIGEVPATYLLESSADLTSLWGVIGGGYTFALSDVMNMVARAYYGISFNNAPVAMQTFGLSFAVEFQG